MQYPIQVALIQPDNIDAIEEKHGQIAAERVVPHTAKLLQDMTGGNGLVIRYGFLFVWNCHRGANSVASRSNDRKLPSAFGDGADDDRRTID